MIVSPPLHRATLGIGILLVSTCAFGADVDFARDIRPILSDNCIYCHGPDEEHREAGLRLDLQEAAFEERDGVTAFAPGDLAKSDSWQRIITGDRKELMPPPESNKKLTAEQKDLIKRWIEAGAEWSGHWAFDGPKKPDLPGATSDSAAKSPVDRFVVAAMTEQGLAHSPEADRSTLIRRLSLDLTGLPPAPDEVESFLADKSGNAYEKQVDRLLASKHFGERMATYWLDAARYGDTSVMHADGPRDMWPWRDWVIEAYNKNQPFDQFSIDQLAGDLIPNATLSQKVASGFNRNHPSSDEGGAIPEELRVSYVVDRVKTTSNVWLGLSMECGQCHEHKYDPITQREYYQFYAYFNNTADPGMQTRRGNQAPVVEVMTPVEEGEFTRIEGVLKTSAAQVKKHGTEAKKSFAEWTKAHPGNNEAAPDLKARFANLKHHFPLDEPDGKTVLDLRSAKDGSVKKALSAVKKGKFGGAMKFKGGADSVVVVPDFTDFDHKSSLTFSAWIKIAEPITAAFISKMDDKKKYRGFDFWIEKGRPGAHFINQWPKNAVKVVSDTALVPNQWHHVALTYNGSGTSEGFAIYIDGKAAPHKITGGKKLTRTIKTDQPFRIGGRSTGSYFKGEIDDLQIYNRVLNPAEVTWTSLDLVSEAKTTIAAKRSPEQRRILERWHLSTNSAPYRDARASFLAAGLERKQILEGKTTVMVMQDNPADKMRQTFLLNRGAYDQPKKDDVILPGTPAILPPLPEGAPSNRLGLAQWLFADNHPLTARVTVNQLWQLLFGTGIVETPADFGSQGAFPTHPALLDWLAVDFRESGWNVKRMIKQLVMSQTYRQSSRVLPVHLEKDPTNRFLARAPRSRLPAEFIRDNALELSGLLLREKIGGPGVKPYQPPGLWAEVGLGGNPKFVQDRGEKLYRRSLYTYWKRSSPPPAMQIFDAPTRESCTLKRPVTNTPLQALAAMNDVQMLEASRHLAERILCHGGRSPESRARFAFQLATARLPAAPELAAMVNLYQQSLDKFGSAPEMAAALLSAGESKRDETLAPKEHAAWTTVASLLLNLDETLTRN